MRNVYESIYWCTLGGGVFVCGTRGLWMEFFAIFAVNAATGIIAHRFTRRPPSPESPR